MNIKKKSSEQVSLKTQEYNYKFEFCFFFLLSRPQTYLLVGSLGLGSLSSLSLLVLVLLQQRLRGKDVGLGGDGSSGHC